MADEKVLYDLLSMLDRLEELREDLEALELGGRGLGDDGVAAELREEAAVLGLRTVADVERRIAELNAQVDLRDDLVSPPLPDDDLPTTDG